MEKKSRNRIYSYDFVRVVSILAVIMIHSIAFVVLQDAVMSSKTWLAANMIDSLCRWCVPVFIMLSGALLIKNDMRNIKKFYYSKVNRIIWPFLFWVFVYTVWYAIFQSNHSWYRDLFHGIHQLITGHPIGPHLYFIQIIIGLYAVTPLISAIVGRFSIRAVTKLSIAILLLSSVSWYISANVTHNDGVNMITRFIPYIGYYMLGYVMGQYRRELLRLFHGWQLTVLYIIFGLVIALGTLYVSVENGGKFDGMLYDYLSLPVIGMSIIVFIGLQKLSDLIDNRKLFETLMGVDYKGSITYLSSIVFGIYFVHYLVLDIFWIKFDSLKSTHNDVVAALFAFVTVVFASFVLVGIYRYIRKSVIYLRRSILRSNIHVYE